MTMAWCRRCRQAAFDLVASTGMMEEYQEDEDDFDQADVNHDGVLTRYAALARFKQDASIAAGVARDEYKIAFPNSP